MSNIRLNLDRPQATLPLGCLSVPGSLGERQIQDDPATMFAVGLGIILAQRCPGNHGIDPDAATLTVAMALELSAIQRKIGVSFDKGTAQNDTQQLVHQLTRLLGLIERLPQFGIKMSYGHINAFLAECHKLKTESVESVVLSILPNATDDLKRTLEGATAPLWDIGRAVSDGRVLFEHWIDHLQIELSFFTQLSAEQIGRWGDIFKAILNDTLKALEHDRPLALPGQIRSELQSLLCHSFLLFTLSDSDSRQLLTGLMAGTIAMQKSGLLDRYLDLRDSDSSQDICLKRFVEDMFTMGYCHHFLVSELKLAPADVRATLDPVPAQEVGLLLRILGGDKTQELLRYLKGQGIFTSDCNLPGFLCHFVYRPSAGEGSPCYGEILLELSKSGDKAAGKRVLAGIFVKNWHIFNSYDLLGQAATLIQNGSFNVGERQRLLSAAVNYLKCDNTDKARRCLAGDRSMLTPTTNGDHHSSVVVASNRVVRHKLSRVDSLIAALKTDTQTKEALTALLTENATSLRGRIARQLLDSQNDKIVEILPFLVTAEYEPKLVQLTKATDVVSFVYAIDRNKNRLVQRIVSWLNDNTTSELPEDISTALRSSNGGTQAVELSPSSPQIAFKYPIRRFIVVGGDYGEDKRNIIRDALPPEIELLFKTPEEARRINNFTPTDMVVLSIAAMSHAQSGPIIAACRQGGAKFESVTTQGLDRLMHLADRVTPIATQF